MVVQAALNLHHIKACNVVGSSTTGESTTTTAGHSLRGVKSCGESGNTLKQKSLFLYYNTIHWSWKK